jgi:hypothetical protein
VSKLPFCTSLCILTARQQCNRVVFGSDRGSYWRFTRCRDDRVRSLDKQPHLSIPHLPLIALPEPHIRFLHILIILFSLLRIKLFLLITSSHHHIKIEHMLVGMRTHWRWHNVASIADATCLGDRAYCLMNMAMST